AQPVALAFDRLLQIGEHEARDLGPRAPVEQHLGIVDGRMAEGEGHQASMARRQAAWKAWIRSSLAPRQAGGSGRQALPCCTPSEIAWSSASTWVLKSAKAPSTALPMTPWRSAGLA